MPSWKKVITSGSNAALNSLTVSNGITSSLFGTASWALNALTSSYSLNPTVSGAINNVNFIDFNESAGVTVQSGQLAWNNTDGTLDLGLKGGNVTLQIGQETLYEVRNATGVTISNGTSLYASGVTAGSGRIEASPFTADGSIREVRFLGLATEDIGNGVNGFVTHFGYTRGLDTRGTAVTAISVGDEDWSVGDILYAHPTAAGKLTNVKPKHEISVAIVIIRHQSTGVLFVRPSSFGHLEDNHDVNINTGSLATGDLLIYDSGSDYWVNSKQLSGSYGLTGSLNATSFVGPLTGNATTATTASHALTASSINPLYQDVELHGNLVVYGTSSFTYVTSSQLAVDDSYISVNVFEPAERFAGLKVYDSGSASHQATASLSWDSTRNHWVYSNASGSTYTGGMFMSGPRNTGSLGDEPTLTKWMVARSDGGDHLENTQIYSSASITQVTGSLTVTQGVTGSLLGTASYATQALSSSFTVSSSRAVTASMAILAPSYLPLAGGTMTGDIYAAGRTFQLQDLVLGVGTTFGTIKTDGGKYIGVYPTNGVESTRFLANGHVLFQNGGTYTDKGYRLQISASNSISGALQVTGNSVMTGSLIVSQGITGSLFGTSSWAQNAVTASFLDSTTNAFVQNGNSFGALALLGTNDNNSLALETSGSTRMFISSSGLVGIGTTSPTFNLQVVGTSYASSYMQTPIVYADSFQPFAASQDFVGKLRNSTYKFDFQKADGTSLAVISGSGNVGIGTTTPSSKLHVSVGNVDGIRVESSNSGYLETGKTGGARWRWANEYSANNLFQLLVNDLAGGVPNLPVLAVSGSGNVGIGTTTPNALLNIVTSASGEAFIFKGSNSKEFVSINHLGYIRSRASDTNGANMHFFDNGGTKRMEMGVSTTAMNWYSDSLASQFFTLQHSTGNVGIGTTTPNSKLEVYDGDISVTTANTFSFLNSNRNFIPNTGGVSLGALRFRGYSTGTTYQVGAAVYSFSQDAWTSTSTPGYLSFQTTPSGSTSPSEKMVITAAGNVGIGTASPNAKLEVIGDLRVYKDGADTLTSSGVYIANGANSRAYNLQQSSTGDSLNLWAYGGSSWANRVTFKADGNVGIGTTTPNAKLDVNGDAIITGSLVVTGRITAEEFHTEFVSSSIIYQSGSTKFGDTADDVHQFTGSLRVNGSITGSLFGTSSWAQNAVTASYTNVGSLGGFIQGGNSFGTTALLGTNDNQPLALETNGTTKMFISSSGNVGIGTTSPLYSLDVVGNIRAYTTLIRRDTSAGSAFINYNESASGYWSVGMPVSSYSYIITDSNYGIDKLAITNGSTWGIGIGKIAPSARLDVSGSAIISGSFTVTPGTVREFQVNTTGIDIGNLITDTHTVTGSLSVSGSVNILSSTLQYSNVASVTSGSTSNVASFSTGSYTAAFFDYVTTSGTSARAGSVFTVWNGNSVEYTETSTNDIGSTSNLILSASVTAGAIRLQATSLSGSWSVKTLARML
jgi:hypothetical protein